MVIPQKIVVTYHQKNVFKQMFAQYFSAYIGALKKSLSPKFNRDMVFKAGEGAGRSGSFFFFSHDRRFIIKTMTSGECELYLRKLQAFKKHYLNNPNSLLAKIFGVYTVKTASVDKIHIMLMENTLQLKDPSLLRHIFDLKGSLVDRNVKGKTTPSTTLKDINYLKV